jgi:hypothetical protein
VSSGDYSYLEGEEWVLRTRVMRRTEASISLTHDASIRATAATRAKWNAHFWSLFPGSPNEFHAAVLRGDIAVSIMFRFRPSAGLKETYGGQPVLKVARTADAWRGRERQLPPSLASAVDDYERDRRRLEEQRRRAWLELLHLRLPTPAAGYRWELESGDPRSFSDVLQFKLGTR